MVFLAKKYRKEIGLYKISVFENVTYFILQMLIFPLKLNKQETNLV